MVVREVVGCVSAGSGVMSLLSRMILAKLYMNDELAWICVGRQA